MDIERPTAAEMEKFYARWRSGSVSQVDITFVNKQASTNEITSVSLDIGKEITEFTIEPLDIGKVLSSSRLFSFGSCQ
jgi:hypothetical protein